MSSKIRSIEKALQDRRARGAQQGQRFAVEGEVAPMMPHPGQSVEFTWADPALLDSPRLVLGFIVSQASPLSASRVNGWVVMDPTMTMADQQGRPIQAPALVPVGNAAYCRDRKPMTWRFHGDFVEPEATDAAEAPAAEA